MPSLTQSKTQQFRGVAQLVAHLVWDQGVAGSNPVTPTTENNDVARFSGASRSRKRNRSSGCSAVGSASGLGPGGRRFESCHPDEKNSLKKLREFFCYIGP